MSGSELRGRKKGPACSVVSEPGSRFPMFALKTWYWGWNEVAQNGTNGVFSQFKTKKNNLWLDGRPALLLGRSPRWSRFNPQKKTSRFIRLWCSSLCSCASFRDQCVSSPFSFKKKRQKCWSDLWPLDGGGAPALYCRFRESCRGNQKRVSWTSAAAEPRWTMSECVKM